MKKSKIVKLVLITAALASCHKKKDDEWNKNVYMRSDTTANYSRAHYYGGGGSGAIWYYAFRPYGFYGIGGYRRFGYYSDAIGEGSNIGSNMAKGEVVRGGFGGMGEGFGVSS